MRGVLITGLAGLWLLSMSALAGAGPWARERGDLFVSLSFSAQSTIERLTMGLPQRDRYGSIYLEYGLGRRFTLGADLGRGESAGEAMIFLRRTLTRPEARLQFAVDLGVGQRFIDGQDDPTRLARAGLSLGHSFGDAPFQHPLMARLPIDPQGGWLSLDAYGVQDLDNETSRWKAEATLGLSLANGHALMLQAVAEEWPGSDVVYTINPSYLMRFANGTAVELGARMSIEDSARVGLEIGFWREF